MENLYLIVGLGNPGEEYALTRHNAGFQVAEELARRWRARWTVEKKFNARMARAGRDEKKLLLCEPLSFMNASGEVVRAVSDYFQAGLERMLVAVDDADIPLGEIRLRGQGGSGGHHGLESIIQHLGSQEFTRLRMGIGRTQDGRREITGHVLGEFSRLETERFEKVLRRAADQVECWLSLGLQVAMNQFNGVVDSAEDK
ncbi:MAG: aminoacyl-tRNA hydrolase [Verrucomicrobia bacterium]|nr:aminoacyl-tRNA hydrolase [Verrucomicrobiota bacterium]